MLVTTQSVKAKVLVSSLSVLIIVFLEINYKFGLKKKKANKYTWSILFT